MKQTVSRVSRQRQIEIQTPRRTRYDAFRCGVELPPDAPTTIQERATLTPIGITPKVSSQDYAGVQASANNRTLS